jgi:hypothetical protein
MNFDPFKKPSNSLLNLFPFKITKGGMNKAPTAFMHAMAVIFSPRSVYFPHYAHFAAKTLLGDLLFK